MYQKPLRTYERNPKPASVAATNAFIPYNFMSPSSSDSEYTFHYKKKNAADTSNSMDSTFDRLLKTAKLPPLPVQPLDNTEYTSSSSDTSDDEPLELIPIENPKFVRESNGRNRKKKASQKNVNKKELSKNPKKPRKREPIKRDYSNDDTGNDSVEFPPLRKTRRAANKQSTSENLTDKLPDKLDNHSKSTVTKELKECCVILTRVNLNDKSFGICQSSTSAFQVNNQHHDSEKNFETDNFEEKFLNAKKCRVILSRLNTNLEQKQQEQQREVLQQPKPGKHQSKNLLNVNMSVISSTPCEKRTIPKRSRPTLSPIKSNINIPVVNDDSRTILFDETTELFSSDGNSGKKELSKKRQVKKLSKIKEKNIVEYMDNDETLEKTGKLDVKGFTPDASAFSSSLYRKSTKLISDDSDEVIQDTYANININNSSEIVAVQKLKQFQKLKRLKINTTEEEKENSYSSNSASSLLLSEVKDVEIDETNEKSMNSMDSSNESYKINSELDSESNSEKNSGDSEVNESTKSKRNLRITSMEEKVNKTEENENLADLQNLTIYIDSQYDTIETSKDSNSEPDNNSMSLDISENDEDSIRLVLSSTSSDKDSIENNSKKVINDQDLFNSNNDNDIVSSNMDNNNSNTEKENSENFVQPVVILTRLKDPIRISEKKGTYRNWKRPLDVILESSSKRSLDSTTKRLSMNESNTEGTNSKEKSVNDSEVFENLRSQEKNNDSINNVSLKPDDDKVLFLKPGKSWARSLSILNNIHNEKDIEFLSLGKGKKWRQSVRSVLSMQPQGLISSCVKDTENNDKIFHGVSRSVEQRVSLSTSHGAIESSSPGRFIRRMSIRVVPNIKNNDVRDKVIQDTSFLEVYGITSIPTDKHSSRTKSLSKVQRKTLEYNLKCSNVPETILPEPVISAKSVVLERCNQKDSISFDKCYPDSYLRYCRKIGEGVYGEVFLYDHQKQKSVIKIIPIEGNELVNGESQKKFNEILSEIIIAKELHNLRFHETYRTSGFVEVKNIRCINGKYPQKLLDLWQIYDDEKNSENDCPSMFGENQLYIALELGDGGQDLEAFIFHNATETYTTFLQTALTLAVGEKSLDFEHRDMHWGNILISRTKDKEVSYKLGDEEITLACNGLKVAIIDFTLSRMSYQECCIFNDLALDPALFNAAGEYQFEIYRLMRAKTGNNWQLFEPYTNILWLHYTLDKMITEVRYNKKTTKIHKNTIQKLQELKEVILEYDSAFDFISNCDKLSNLQRRC